MNSPLSSKQCPMIATGIDWLTVIDGREGVYGFAKDLQHALHHLMCDLEHSFDFDRATTRDGDSLTFTFQRDGIDGTLWLLGKAWCSAKDLVELVEAVQLVMDEEDKP